MPRVFADFALLTVVMATLLTGCQRPAPPSELATASQGDAMAESFAKLSPEDRALAEAQGYCAVEPESRLGSMGMPIKVLVKDQPVFVCCAGCEKKAVREADATLARVAELKSKVAAEKAASP